MDLPSEPVLRTLLRRTAALRQRLLTELGQRPLVLPDARSFPDPYLADAPTLLTLVRRMQQHAGMSDIPLSVGIVAGGGAAPSDCGSCGPSGGSCGTSASEAPASPQAEKKPGCDGKGGCGGGCHDDEPMADEAGCCGGGCHDASEPKATSGGCCSSVSEPVEEPEGPTPRLVDLGEGWRLQVPEGELRHDVALTTNLARSLGYVFLLETRSARQPLEEPIDVTADIASCLLGFGSLMLAGSYIYAKSCGGPSIRRVTALGPIELAFVTVLVASTEGHSLSALRKHLGPTQSSAVDEAEAWLKRRPKLVAAFRDEPGQLAAGTMSLEAERVSLWSRWFGTSSAVKPKSDDVEEGLANLEAMLAEAPLSRRPRGARGASAKDDLRALVDETFDEGALQ